MNKGWNLAGHGIRSAVRLESLTYWTFTQRIAEYNERMSPKLTPEQREAIRQHGGAVEVEDEETREVYVIVAGDLHQRAMQALEEHDARQAICAGIEDLEAGRVVPFAEIDARLRKKLGLPERAS
jgi:hypothetical protein